MLAPRMCHPAPISETGSRRGSWSRSPSSSMYWLCVRASSQVHITSAEQGLSSAAQEACNMHGQIEQSRP